MDPQHWWGNVSQCNLGGKNMKKGKRKKEKRERKIIKIKY
jgi:hypothetical protein